MSKISNFLVLTIGEITPESRGGWIIIGRLSELTDRQCEEFVENDGDSYGAWYKDY